MNLSTKQKQTHRHKEQTCGCQGEKRWGRDKLGVWGQSMQTIVYRMDKQLGPTVYSTGNYIQSSVINHNGKEYERECIYVCITESLCRIAEINTTL